MKTTAIIVCAAAALSACATYNVRSNATIDQSDKTVTVAPGAKGLLGPIKDALRTEGWKMSVQRGPIVTAGHAGDSVSLEHTETFKTRYLLVVTSKVVDSCLNFSPAIKYDISLIDNTTGEEALTMNGFACETQVIEKFVQSIR